MPPSHPLAAARHRWVVAYDVSDDHRRRLIARCLEGIGERRQRSVFECDLTAKELAGLRAALAEVADFKEDRIRYYPLCLTCREESRRQGDPSAPGEDGYYLV